MFFDIGWSELLLIGGVALIFIGPKDLPQALRVAGYWVRKARGLSREFQSSVDQMIREAELDDMRRELKKATEFDIEKEFQKTIEPPASRPPVMPEALPAPDAIEVSRAIEAPALVEPEPVHETIAPSAPVFEPPPVHGFDSPDPRAPETWPGS